MGAAVIVNVFCIVVECGSVNQEALKCIFIAMQLKPSDVKIVFDPPHEHFGSCILPQCKTATIFFNLEKF